MENNYHGEYKIWNTNGNIAVDGNYNLGLKIGEWKWFNRNGKKDSIKVYSGGMLNGLSTIYFDGKQPYKLMNYINDMLHGEMKIFYNSLIRTHILYFKFHLLLFRITLVLFFTICLQKNHYLFLLMI